MGAVRKMGFTPVGGAATSLQLSTSCYISTRPVRPNTEGARLPTAGACSVLGLAARACIALTRKTQANQASVAAGSPLRRVASASAGSTDDNLTTTGPTSPDARRYRFLAWSEESAYLSGFAITADSRRQPRSSLTRRRSLVRTQHRPLRNYLEMAVF